MRPDLRTPDTLQIMLFARRDKALCMVSYRADSSEVTALPMQATGKPWAALQHALQRAGSVGAEHVLVVSNVPEVVDMLSPMRFYEDRLLETEPDAHWQVNATLTTRYPGRYAAMHAEHMPKTEAVWQLHYNKTIN